MHLLSLPTLLLCVGCDLWTDAEKTLFNDALGTYGKDFSLIQKMVKHNKWLFFVQHDDTRHHNHGHMISQQFTDIKIIILWVKSVHRMKNRTSAPQVFCFFAGWLLQGETVFSSDAIFFFFLPIPVQFLVSHHAITGLHRLP